jgi:probable phosphoglycerate mutase
MTTEVYLIRHGETMFNQLNKVQGWADSPLTIKGINDLKKTAEALSQIHFDNMYSSDLKRAIDTVHLMKNANEVSEIGKIKKLPEFREATKAADPRHLAENYDELNTRMIRAIKKLREETVNENRVLLVSHGDFIKTLAIKYWNKSDGIHDIAFPDNGSITRGILSDDGKFEIVDYNIKAEDF